MASGFTPPSDDRSRTTRGSDDSAPALGSRDLVPAVSVARARTRSRPRAQAKAQAGSDGTSTPSTTKGVSLSAHQASEMASAAASSGLQGHQAAVLAQARQRFVESEANQVVDQVRSEARSFGHHVVTETQAEALRFRQELEHQAQEVLASATQAVSHAEARSRETERRRGKRLGSYKFSLVAPVVPWVKVMTKPECSKRKFNNSRMKRVNLQHALRG